MKIGVIGLGYVGATTAVILAGKVGKNKKIFDVIGIEQNSTKGKKIIKELKKGIFPFKCNDKNILINLKKKQKKKKFKLNY